MGNDGSKVSGSGSNSGDKEEDGKKAKIKKGKDAKKEEGKKRSSSLEQKSEQPQLDNKLNDDDDDNSGEDKLARTGVGVFKRGIQQQQQQQQSEQQENELVNKAYQVITKLESKINDAKFQEQQGNRTNAFQILQKTKQQCDNAISILRSKQQYSKIKQFPSIKSKLESLLTQINSKLNTYNNNPIINSNNNYNTLPPQKQNQHPPESSHIKKKPNVHTKEDEEMDAKIMSEIMSTNPNVKFSDIIGMENLKQILYEIIIMPNIRPEFFTGLRQPQRGLLLFGPPGTGKTMIAKAIASECNSTFFNISASSLTSKYVGESEKTVKSLFKLAYQRQPSIIFIDEIDSILSKRSDNDNEAAKRIKTEFLIQFDGVGSNTEAKLLVIAATNRPMDLDDALMRRLPKRVYCGPLDVKGREKFIENTIHKVECKLSEGDIKEIAKRTENYSNSDLKELCREAAYEPVRELSNEEILKIKKFRPVEVKDLRKAVNKIRGTINKEMLKELNKWNQEYGTLG